MALPTLSLLTPGLQNCRVYIPVVLSHPVVCDNYNSLRKLMTFSFGYQTKTLKKYEGVRSEGGREWRRRRRREN